MKSRLFLAVILVTLIVGLTACSNSSTRISNSISTTATINADKAWLQWAADTNNVLIPDLSNLLMYQPYDQPTYMAIVQSAAIQLETDCANYILQGKNLKSSSSMKTQLADFKNALSLYSQGAEALTATSSSTPYATRAQTANSDFQQATTLMNKANIASLLTATTTSP